MLALTAVRTSGAGDGSAIPAARRGRRADALPCAPPKRERPAPPASSSSSTAAVRLASARPHGWSEAIDLALARPDLVVVTRDGDRFSSTGWRVRAAGGAVTAAVVDEARDRASVAEAEAASLAEERSAARDHLEAMRQSLAAAVRADDRNEVDHEAARGGSQRVADDLDAAAAEIEEIRRSRGELEDRIERDRDRITAVEEVLPVLEAEQAAVAEQGAVVADERRAHRRPGGHAPVPPHRPRGRGSAGLTERRRVLAERLAEVERRLTGHADERQLAADRRRRLEADATAVERLAALGRRLPQSSWTPHLAALRERESAPARRRRAGWRAARGAAPPAGHRRARDGRGARPAPEGRDGPGRGHSAPRGGHRGPATASSVAAPTRPWVRPSRSSPRALDPSMRAGQLEAELAAMGPVNPLALEELAELSERHQFLETQVEDVRTARRELHHVIRTLDEEIMQVFDTAFADVNEHFSNLVTTLFPGGTGRLSLTDPEQPPRHRRRDRGAAGRPQRPAALAAVGG